MAPVREILRNRKIGKYLVALGNEHDAQAGDLVRRPVFDALPLKVMAPSVTRASSIPRKPEIARNVVVLPAPLVPSKATICPDCTVKRDALHGRDHAVIDHLDLFDAAATLPAHFRPPASRPVFERPQQKIVLHAAPDADQAERLKHQKQDHDDAERRVVDGEHDSAARPAHSAACIIPASIT